MIDLSEPSWLRLRCPACGGELTNAEEGLRTCASSPEIRFRFDGGVWWREGGVPGHEAFLESYRMLRAAEGRGSEEGEWYLRLPQVEPGDPHAREWNARRRSAEWLVNWIGGRRLRLLDAGGGCGWMARRLETVECEAVVVDINRDRRDGLGAIRHYREAGALITGVEGAFEELPLADALVDLFLYNGSFHYATDQRKALREARRLLRPGGAIVIIDSPLYRHQRSGERMVRERGGDDRARYLTYGEMERLAEACRLQLEVIPEPTTPASELRRLVGELRRGRRFARMDRLILRPKGERLST